MNFVGALIVYILLWWVTFFTVLPWGIKGRWESKDDGILGAEPGAPADPNLEKKLFQTTIVSYCFWVIIVLIISSDIINFRQ